MEKRYTVLVWGDNFLEAKVIASKRTKDELEEFFATNVGLAVKPRDFIIVEEKDFDINVEFYGSTGEDDELTITLTIEE